MFDLTAGCKAALFSAYSLKQSTSESIFQVKTYLISIKDIQNSIELCV